MTNSVAYFDVRFVNSYIGWDVAAYNGEGHMVDEVADSSGLAWHFPEYYYLKRDAVRRAKELASGLGVNDIRVAKRKDGGWYPEGLKA